jgi:hypothetical protein
MNNAILRPPSIEFRLIMAGSKLESSDDDFLEPFQRDYHKAEWRDICTSFIDPLVDEVEQWLRNFPSLDEGQERVIEHLEDFPYIMHAIATGTGSQEAIDNWRRAKVWLDVNVSTEFCSGLAERAKSVFDAANALVTGVRRHSVEQCDADINIFVLNVVDFLDHLRNVSLALQSRFPNAGVSRLPGDRGGERSETDLAENVQREGRQGYLEMRFDEHRFVVTRAGFVNEVDLANSPLYWAILIRLEKSRDAPLADELLAGVWSKHGTEVDPEWGTIVDAISDFRKKLKAIGVGISRVRKRGYRLVSIAEAEKKAQNQGTRLGGKRRRRKSP